MNMKKQVFSNPPLGNMKSLLLALLIVFATLPLAAADEAECVVEQTNCAPIEPRIDVVFVIDSTGSMADEIRTVKNASDKDNKRGSKRTTKP